MFVAAAGSSEQKKKKTQAVAFLLAYHLPEKAINIRRGKSEAGTRVWNMIGYGFCIPE